MSHIDLIRKEALLEPLFRTLRFAVSQADIPKHVETCVDLGCGPTSPFLTYMLAQGTHVETYIGIDPLLNHNASASSKHKTHIELKQFKASDLSGIANRSVDLVVGFAFLEHIENPQQILTETIRILHKGGKALFTTPTPISKPVLEFLSSKLHIVSEREILEHKTYFTKESLFSMVQSHIDAGEVQATHRYFELGFNNYLTLTKIV